MSWIEFSILFPRVPILIIIMMFNVQMRWHCVLFFEVETVKLPISLHVLDTYEVISLYSAALSHHKFDFQECCVQTMISRLSTSTFLWHTNSKRLLCTRILASLNNSISNIQSQTFSSSKSTETDKNSKVVSNAKEAISSHLFSGARVNVGGFGLGGIPETLLNEVARDPRAQELTVASLTAGIDGFGLGKLFESGKVKRMIASYVGENKNFEEMFFGGDLEVELTPQGTIAARMQAAGAGVPAFFTPSGAGM